MKRSKLLIPLITLAGTASIAAPVMCLTSCTQGEKYEEHFTFPTASKEYQTSNTAGTIPLTFVAKDQLTEKQASLIEFIAVCKTTGSNISLTRCTSSSTDRHTFYVKVDFTIDPAAFKEGETFEYDIKIHNGSWYQMEKGFSLKAKKAE